MSSQLPYSVYPSNGGSGGGGLPQDLQQVLTVGNNAGALNILNVNNLAINGTVSASGSVGLPTQFLSSNGGLPATWGTPVGSQNLSQVLTIGNSATNQDIGQVNEITANELTAYLPTNDDLPNNNSDGLYSFDIKYGTYNINTLTNLPQSPFNAVFGFPTQQPSINYNNKSINADTRAMSQFTDYPAPATPLAPITDLYCLNFGLWTGVTDDCIYDPMNMRDFLDVVSLRWIGCGTPPPFNVNLILGSWTITVYMDGIWGAYDPINTGRIILEQWRSGAYLRSYVITHFTGDTSLTNTEASVFVLSGIYQDDWIPNRDGWRMLIRNVSTTQTFFINKINATFEWRQLS